MALISSMVSPLECAEEGAMTEIAVIMTAHNRRNKTVACLRSLMAATEHAADIACHVFLVDDGSTDGTSEAVAGLALPLTIIRGDGDLYWNRGMVRAWASANAFGRFDGFLLLNDDTLLDADAVAKLVSVSSDHAHRAIIVGAVRDPHLGHLTYGGVRRVSSWHPGRVVRVPASDAPQQADAFHANCAYVPAAVCDTIGTLDPVFHHGMGDFDYGYRATRNGFSVIVAPGMVGTCPRNDPAGTWQDPTVPLRRRLAMLASPKGLPRRQWREFLRRHGAPFPSLLSWMPTLQVVRSSTWRRPTRFGRR
jgi:GT2 family glycosyltransferase